MKDPSSAGMSVLQKVISDLSALPKVTLVSGRNCSNLLPLLGIRSVPINQEPLLGFPVLIHHLLPNDFLLMLWEHEGEEKLLAYKIEEGRAVACEIAPGNPLYNVTRTLLLQSSERKAP